MIVEEIAIIKQIDIDVIFPSSINRGETFEFTVVLRNEFNVMLEGVSIEIISPAAVKLLSNSSIVIGILDVGEEKSFPVKALAVYGGREIVRVELASTDLTIAKDFALDISGLGWYGGDNHSHSNNSDGVNTVEESAESAYKKWNLSWLVHSDHNTNVQAAEAEAVTAKMKGKFISISATEITTGYPYKPTTPSGDPRGHGLVYGYKDIPTLVITEKDGSFNWQDSIDQVVNAGALFYIAHPFSKAYSFEDVYSWRNYTGVEVWNGVAQASHDINKKAFEFWDKINIRGEKKYYGIAGTDGHSIRKIGDLHTKGMLDMLTVDNIFHLLKTGQFYGTNGPDLRFSINGVGMGNTLTIKQAGNITIKLEAFSKDGNLINIKVLGYPITGNIDDYNLGEVVFEKDLAGMNTDFFSTSVSINISQNMFFRLEVKSENCTPGPVRPGPETGTGFAYSNPVWVEIGSEDTSLDIRNISYGGVGAATEADGFGRKILKVSTRSFDVNALIVDSGGTVTKSFTEVSHEESDVIGLLDINVSASESVKTTYSFVVCYTS
jgi:hypothetical protein